MTDFEAFVTNAAVASALTGVELSPVIQGSVTKKQTLALLGSGIIDAAANVVVGTRLAALTTGIQNTAIGGLCLGSVTSGSYNTAVGRAALYVATTASYNTAIGMDTLTSLLTGVENVALGYGALNGEISGSYNTSVGYLSLTATTASLNTGIGRRALASCTTGSGNTAIGVNVADVVTTGSNNTFLGYAANTTKAALSKGIALGYNASVVNDNECVIGGTGTDAVSVGWAGTTAPADTDITAGQFFIYWDSTNGAAKLKIKGKSANGTVVTGQVALS